MTQIVYINYRCIIYEINNNYCIDIDIISKYTNNNTSKQY